MINWLRLYREKFTIYCKNHTKHTNTLGGENAEFWYIYAADTPVTIRFQRVKTGQQDS
jgi:hypothetical protein